MSSESTGGFPFETAILERARASGAWLGPREVAALAAHARAVYAANPGLHLTAISDPSEFVARHIGESLEGAALLPPLIVGLLLDLGSGNGYPGIPVAVARPGLIPVLAESSARKAGFLRQALAAAGLGHGQVLHRRVVRAADLENLAPISVLVSRAAGGWDRIVPKLTSRLEAGARVLLWAGPDAESILRRPAWRRLRLASIHPLSGRDRSYVHLLVNDNNYNK